MGYKCPAIAGHFQMFPSKRNRDTASEIQNQKDKGSWDDLDPDTTCDDGDQTSYNGLLCASGVALGCRAIAEAQDAVGRFYRSPHRRWIWEARCNDKQNPLNEQLYNDRCAYGFSPDMNLGVLLYTLSTGKVDRYRHWLAWLDRTVPTTKLCKLKDGEFYDCKQVDWPRVCPEDMGHGQEPGVEILGMYGGKCALRPQDALDFAVVNRATSTNPPSRMSTWEVESRAAIAGARGIASAIFPPGELLTRSPLVLMSTVERRNFPAHLDAIRVLIRMMILNPSLKMDNLPSTPDPDQIVPGLLGAAASDSTDILSINLAAKALVLQDGENPFYALLADGPTPSVRARILEGCPSAADAPNAEHWIWEKFPDEEYRKKQYSMGWDCVFIGSLYNKMRVRKDLVDELLDRFLKFVDPVENIYKQASEALQAAEAANDVATKGLELSQKKLTEAQEFVDHEYAQQRETAKKAVEDLTDKIAKFAKQVSDLEAKLPQLRNQAAQLPDTIQEKIEKEVCKWAGPLRKLCDTVTEIKDKVNQPKRDLLNQIADVEGQINNLRGRSIAEAQTQLKANIQLIADLDKKLQSVRATLQSKTLEAAVRISRESLKIASKALYEARVGAAEAHRAYARVKGNLAVWKNDKDAIKVADNFVDPPIEPAAPRPEGGDRKPVNEFGEPSKAKGKDGPVADRASRNQLATGHPRGHQHSTRRHTHGDKGYRVSRREHCFGWFWDPIWDEWSRSRRPKLALGQRNKSCGPSWKFAWQWPGPSSIDSRR